MRLPSPLLSGKLVRRYKRFFADIELDDGTLVTAHTPNTGSMLQCAVPGFPVLLSANDNPKRKLKYTLELIRVNGCWVDTHTQRTNRVVEEGLRGGAIVELAGGEVRPEYCFGDSRLDFLVERGTERALVEVKNVTLTDGGSTALFPDAVTLRGQKHLRELAEALEQGYRAVIFFLVQRGEAETFAPADEIDPEYGRLLRDVAGKGVEVLAYRTCVSETENRIGVRLPVRL
ncbi:DNA/RNA nuclease SfsA [Geothermobacter hydrogeniphilus]|uniref:Sugar fermentation stimulation protein homolog n=1 Tax=Geothermobacter hydrogeniphilus TaxID=1969733 RepID=A0A1X0YBB8_9BACT|nr:DNA/RNA nuclease SfsA [Geothermobacter hydrogeniphilus]ORJ62402.1 sugar fermentation stimulation protein SfsA [Geothermobacter hydrogeniphilus]